MQRGRSRSRLWLPVLLLLAACDGSGGDALPAASERPGAAAPHARSGALRAGTVYRPLPAGGVTNVDLREIPIPAFPGADAIWGAIGRDDAGHIWFGVSTRSTESGARLFEYDPRAERITPRGDVLDALRAAGLHRPGASQVKIHSKIQQADDGLLYFTSMDEQGEEPYGGIPPRWGSHLWRIDPASGRWAHVLAAEEGLVALATGGRFVYALGYFGHVVYQYDTLTGATRRRAVGAVCGHVSRNIAADLRGHVYVPRVSWVETGQVEEPNSCRGEHLRAQLVELDTDLEEVAATPLAHYLRAGRAHADQGIVGVARLDDTTLAFTTHSGQLYSVLPVPGQTALVLHQGAFAGGGAYAPSLFALDGRHVLGGVARLGGKGHAWVSQDLRTRRSASVPLPVGHLHQLLLYGSETRDDAGALYVGGRVNDAGLRPFFARIVIE